MVSFRTLARAISPFAGKSKSGNKSDASELQWDLSNIDLARALTEFYQVYNISRLDSVGEIVKEYEGEEQELLQQLCERYGLTQRGIQQYLDRAKKPAASLTRQLSNSVSEGKRVTIDTSENGDVSSYYWDASKVDIAEALRLIYHDHNPDKIPKVSKLEEKSNDDIVLLLQHLCKRHNLSQSDMQEYLVKAGGRKKVPVGSTADTLHGGQRKPHVRKSVIQQAPPPTSTPVRHHRIEPVAELAVVSSAASETSDITTSLPSAAPSPPDGTASLEDASKPPLARPPAPPPTPPPPPPLPPHPAPSEHAPLSTVPFSTSGSGGGIGGAKTNTTTNENEGMTEQERRAQLSRRLRPVLPGGTRFSLGPVLKEFQGVAPPRYRTESDELSSNRAMAVTEAHAPFAENTGGYDDSKDSNNQQSSAPVNITQLKRELDETRTQLESANRDSQDVMRMLQETAAQQKQQQEQQEEQRVQRGELAEIKAELERTRQQLSTVNQENHEVLEMLKQQMKSGDAVVADGATSSSSVASCTSQNKNKPQQKEHASSSSTVASSVNSAGAGTDALSSTAERSALAAMQIENMGKEVSRLTDQLQEQKENATRHKRRLEKVTTKLRIAESKLRQEERKRLDAEADRKDLLQLIDVMSASPVSITGVLDAYLKKLGDVTGSVPVRFGVSNEGRKLHISERISIALSIKRQQEHSSRPRAHEYDDIDALQQQHQQSSSEEKNTGQPAEDDSEASRSTFLDSEDDAYHTLTKQEQNMYQSMLNGLKATDGKKAGRTGDRAQKRGESGHHSQYTPNSAVSGVALSDQYDLAKKVLLHQQSHSKLANQLAANNLSAQQKHVDKTIHSSIDKDNRILLGEEVVKSTTAEERVGGTEVPAVDDWVECFDPRSQRKYYYSSSLKKSTWKKPHSAAEQSRSGRPASASGGKGTAGRSASPNRFLAEQQQRAQAASSSRLRPQQLDDDNNSLGGGTNSDGVSIITSNSYYTPNGNGSSSSRNVSRDPSPFSTRSEYGAQGRGGGGAAAAAGGFSASQSIRSASPNSRFAASAAALRGGTRSLPASPSSLRPTASSNGKDRRHDMGDSSRKSGGRKQNRSKWVTALDPKTQRRYWYNRETKTSTWRQPAELII